MGFLFLPPLEDVKIQGLQAREGFRLHPHLDKSRLPQESWLLVPFFPVPGPWEESEEAGLGLLPLEGLWARERRKGLLAYSRVFGGPPGAGRGLGHSGLSCKKRRKMERLTNRKEPRLAVFWLKPSKHPEKHPDFAKEN